MQRHRQSSLQKLPIDLIIVCCHAIYHGGVNGDPRHEGNWALQPFQRGDGLKQGEHLTLLRHVEAAFEAADEQAVVVFSGGCTNPEYPHLSESRSYLDAASALSLRDNEHQEVLLDESATDSYQNLLFSIIVFRKKFGRFPSHIKVITHDFKVARFRHLHANAIRWPIERLEVIGINPPFLGESILESASFFIEIPTDTLLFRWLPSLGDISADIAWQSQSEDVDRQILESLLQRFVLSCVISFIQSFTWFGALPFFSQERQFKLLHVL